MNNFFDKALERENKKNAIYKHLIKKIYSKIKINNKKNIFKLTTEIQTYYIGYTSYDMKIALYYIIKYFRTRKFFIKYLYPNIIFISWEHMITNKTHKNEINKMKPMYDDDFNRTKQLTSEDIGIVNNVFYKNNDEDFDKELDKLDQVFK
jgi:hypothetical protein